MSLHIINKLGLYINSRYWGKILIKLLNLTNSVHNFNNNGSETEKSDIKTTYRVSKACWQVFMWSCKSCEVKDLRHDGTWARELASHVDTWVRKHPTCWYVRHVSTQGMLAREQVSTQDTIAREHVSTQDTRACKHAGHVDAWARKHAKHVGMWVRKHEMHVSTLRKARWYVST